MSTSRYRIHEPDQPHFLTCTVVGWLPVFTRPEAAQIVLDSWSFLTRERQMRLYAFVILENHVHWIAQSPQLDDAVHDFKSFTAHRLVELLEANRATTILSQLRQNKSLSRITRLNQIWIEGSHPQLLQNEEMLRQKIEYIHNNPVKRGYVDDPLHWRYSSARAYAGMNSLAPVYLEWVR